LEFILEKIVYQKITQKKTYKSIRLQVAATLVSPDSKIAAFCDPKKLIKSPFQG